MLIQSNKNKWTGKCCWWRRDNNKIDKLPIYWEKNAHEFIIHCLLSDTDKFICSIFSVHWFVCINYLIICLTFYNRVEWKMNFQPGTEKSPYELEVMRMRRLSTQRLLGRFIECSLERKIDDFQYCSLQFVGGGGGNMEQEKGKWRWNNSYGIYTTFRNPISN